MGDWNTLSEAPDAWLAGLQCPSSAPETPPMPAADPGALAPIPVDLAVNPVPSNLADAAGLYTSPGSVDSVPIESLFGPTPAGADLQYSLPQDLNWVPPFDSSALPPAVDPGIGTAGSSNDLQAAFAPDPLGDLVGLLPADGLSWVSPYDDDNGHSTDGVPLGDAEVNALIPTDTVAGRGDGSSSLSASEVSEKTGITPYGPEGGPYSVRHIAGDAPGEWTVIDKDGRPVARISGSGLPPTYGTENVGDKVIIHIAIPEGASITSLIPDGDKAEIRAHTYRAESTPPEPAAPPAQHHAPHPVEKPPVEGRPPAPGEQAPPVVPQAPAETPPPPEPAPQATQPPQTGSGGQAQPPPPNRQIPPLPLPDVVSGASPIVPHGSAMLFSAQAPPAPATGMDGVQQTFVNLSRPSPSQIATLQSQQPWLFVHPEVQQLLGNLTDALNATRSITDGKIVSAGLPDDGREFARELGRAAHTLPASVFRARYGITPDDARSIGRAVAALDQWQQQRLSQLAQERWAKAASGADEQVRPELHGPAGPGARPLPTLDRDKRLRLLQEKIAADVGAIRNSGPAGAVASFIAALSGRNPAQAAADAAPVDDVLKALAGIGAGRQHFQQYFPSAEDNPGPGRPPTQMAPSANRPEGSQSNGGGRVLALGRSHRHYDLPGGGRVALPVNEELRREARDATGGRLAPTLLRGLRNEGLPPGEDESYGTGFSRLLPQEETEFREGNAPWQHGFTGHASGLMVQQALEGQAPGVKAIYLNTAELGPFTPGAPQTAAEYRSLVAALAAGNHRVDIYIQDGRNLSLIRAGQQTVEGAPLPADLARYLPPSFRVGNE